MKLGVSQKYVDRVAGLKVRTTERIERVDVDHRSMPPDDPSIRQVLAALDKIASNPGMMSEGARRTLVRNLTDRRRPKRKRGAPKLARPALSCSTTQPMSHRRGLRPFRRSASSAAWRAAHAA